MVAMLGCLFSSLSCGLVTQHVSNGAANNGPHKAGSTAEKNHNLLFTSEPSFIVKGRYLRHFAFFVGYDKA
jgi:hypothetical protein